VTTEWLLNVLMLAAEGLVLWLAYLALKRGWVLRGISNAEVRCLLGGFIALCLAINLLTHWGDRMEPRRLFIPIWATLAWSWGVRLYFRGRPNAQ
jgi:hypothetical protein